MAMKKIIAFLLAGSLMVTFPLVFGGEKSKMAVNERLMEETAAIVSKENPFYALIATPVALYYDTNLHVKPLLVQDFNNPSKSIQRFKELYDVSDAILIDNETPTEASIRIAEMVWEHVDEAILIKNDFEGYKLGINIAPLASYKNIPIFVANSLDEIRDALENLGVEKTYVCGDIDGYGSFMKFDSVEEINNFMINFLKQKFGGVNYITMANPLDIQKPKVLDSVEYHFEGRVNSGSTLHGLNILLSGFNYSVSHTFSVPNDYTYARVKIKLVNEASEHVEKWGDRMFLHLIDPDNVTFEYTSTAAGIPVVDENGSITKDQLEYEVCIYDKPGKYKAEIVGTWIVKKKGNYTLDVTVEKLDTTLYPLMKGLSSLAPYLTAFHKGIVFAKEEFAFAANENVTVDGEPCPGIASPVKNPRLTKAANEHVIAIHNELNSILANLAQISSNDLRLLREHYASSPIYIAILADTTMIPHYYYANPDSDFVSGQGAASDFIYGDVDPNAKDTENDTFTYYPYQENAVGRVTGYDAEDCSALIARTVFYDDIIQKLGEWKNTATVQTGTGIEFQKIPILTPLMNKLKSIIGFGPVRDEPTKFWTGESKFINMHICNDTKKGGFNVKSAYRLEAQRIGLAGNAIAKGGEYQRQSNIIFAFDHGSYYLFEAGDMLEFDQFGLGLKTGLSGKGSYDVRHIVNDNYGPSTAFIESCLVGKTEGLSPYNTLSQAFIHAGVNAFVASTRYTADPGYLEPGLILEGFGIWGYINATLNLRLHGSYPDLHFGALIAQDFILDLILNNSTTGMALRDAKNAYLPKDANNTFLWTPPLYTSGNPIDDIMVYLKHSSGGTKAFGKKYVAIHEFILYGDPAFNPYEPINKG